MKNVVLITSWYSLEYDPRLKKEIQTLESANFDITLLCWDRDGIITPNIKRLKIDEHLSVVPLKIRAPKGPKMLMFLPLWWCFLFFRLLFINFDIIHAIDFDTIAMPLLVAKLRNKPIIYEMYDTYEDIIKLPSFIRNFFIYLDKLLMRMVDIVIVVDECRIREFNGIPNKNIFVVYNSPPDTFINDNLPDIDNGNVFNIFYAGFLTHGISLENMLSAVFSIEGVKLTVAGYGDLSEMIEEAAKNNTRKVEFIGKIKHIDVIQHTVSSDLLFSLYDPDIPLYRYASSNKLFEAMMCSKPILVSSGSSMDDIILRENCGIVVDCHSVQDIRRAILRLRDNRELCLKLGSNGRNAYLNKYNWSLMQKRIIEAYSKL